MKNILILFLILFCLSILSAYEDNMPNLITPSIFAPGQLEAEIVHRFYDNIPDIPKYGIFTSGANIRLGIRGCVWDHLIPYFNYDNRQVEITAGANYSIIPEGSFIRGLADLSFFSYEPFFNAPRNQNIFALASAQTARIGKILTINANLGYDNYNQALGGAIGLDIKVFPVFYVFVEYGRNLLGPTENSNINKNGFISCGMKLETMGHHFILVVQNTPEIGMRRMLLGTTSSTNWYFGFNIQRFFDVTAVYQ